MAITQAKTATRRRNSCIYEGAGSAAADILIELTPNECDEFDSLVVLSTIGVVTIVVTLNGTDWSNPVALQDMAGTLIDQAAVTTTSNLYGLVGRFSGLRVLASGGAAKAAIQTWASGRKS